MRNDRTGGVDQIGSHPTVHIELHNVIHISSKLRELAQEMGSLAGICHNSQARVGGEFRESYKTLVNK